MNDIGTFHNRNENRLGQVENEFLQYFAENPSLSAYQIRSLHNSKHNKLMDYKNVHTRVKRLHDLDLIEKVEKKNVEKESNHGAIYYRLSAGGIYNLIHKQRRLFVKILKKFYKTMKII